MFVWVRSWRSRVFVVSGVPARCLRFCQSDIGIFGVFFWIVGWGFFMVPCILEGYVFSLLCFRFLLVVIVRLFLLYPFVDGFAA